MTQERFPLQNIFEKPKDISLKSAFIATIHCCPHLLLRKIHFTWTTTMYKSVLITLSNSFRVSHRLSKNASKDDRVGRYTQWKICKRKRFFWKMRIECYVCQQENKVRETFGCTEWLNHWSSVKHCEKVKINDLNNTTTKLTFYFTSKPIAKLQHPP